MKKSATKKKYTASSKKISHKKLFPPYRQKYTYVLGGLLILILFIVVVKILSAHASVVGGGSPSNKSVLQNFFGGFQIGNRDPNNNSGSGAYDNNRTKDLVAQAASLGIHATVLFEWDSWKLHNSSFVNELKSKKMYVIDAAISNAVGEYYSHQISYNAMWSKINSRISDVTNINKSNSIDGYPLVVSYWILDDQPAGTYGQQRSLLQQIRQKIANSNHFLPTMCGFGPFFGYKNSNSGIVSQPQYYHDFTPQGCDMLGFYAYANPWITKDPSQIDWSMSRLWPKLVSDLKNGSGYSIDTWKGKIIGIPMAFGGHEYDLNGRLKFDWPVPRAQDIKAQTESFCKNGAVGIMFYAWWSRGVQYSPYNNSAIASGIQQGEQACASIWGTTVSTSSFILNIQPNPTPKPTPKPTSAPSSKKDPWYYINGVDPCSKASCGTGTYCWNAASKNNCMKNSNGTKYYGSNGYLYYCKNNKSYQDPVYCPHGCYINSSGPDKCYTSSAH